MMRLEKEFVVGAPLERVWSAMKDPGVLAGSLPGGDLRPRDDVFAGRVELTADGRQIVCDATVRAVDADEDEHTTTVVLHGRQLGGPAVGSATVRSRCEAADSSTRVTLSAELSSSGHAHPGAELEAAAREVFDQAADRLSDLAAAAPAAAATQPAAPAPEAPAPQAETLPVQASTQRTLQRGLLAGGALAGGAVVAVLLARRMRSGRRRRFW